MSSEKEEINKMEKKNGKHGQQLWKWFKCLNPEEKSRVLSFEDKDGLALLRKMYAFKEQQGDGLFYAVGDETYENLLKEKVPKMKFDKSNNFCFRKLSSIDCFCFYPENFFQSDRLLEESVRLCDTREYLDTITVAGELLESPDAFLKLMIQVTRGGFLTDPCKVSYRNDGPKNQGWKWSSPKWFETMGYYSLGTWIAHILEKVLWMRYWHSHKLDPRSKQGAINYVFPNYLEGLLSKNYLITFWKQRLPEERRKIVGSLGNLVEHALINTSEKDKKSSKVSQNLDYTKLLASLIDLSYEGKLIELRYFSDSNLAQNEKTFIELLYFSPLNRAAHPIDLVLRRVGMSIHSAYTEKLSMDLIIGEEAEKIKRTSQEAKKRRNKKKKTIKKKKEKEDKDREEKERREKEEKEIEEREKKEREEKEKYLQREKDKKNIIQNEIRALLLELIEVAIDTKDMKKVRIKTKKKKKKNLDELVAHKKITSDQKNKKQEKTSIKQNSNKHKQSFEHETRSNLTRINSSREGFVHLIPSAPDLDRLGRKLHREIEDFVRQIQVQIATKYRPQARATIAKIQEISESLWPSSSVRVYGSFATSLCIPSSDLDLVILGVTCENPLSTFKQELLRKKHLQLQYLQSIETAKVPVIKVLLQADSIPTDITFNSESSCSPKYFFQGMILQHSGLAACELIKSYLTKLPPLAPLVMVLKQYLFNKGLNNVYTGGLSSYCLVLMVISFLLIKEDETSIAGPTKECNLGSLLLDFLEYYGKKFDYENMGISVSLNRGAHFYLKDTFFKNGNSPLVLVDPFNPSSNIGQNIFGMPNVRQAFLELHSKFISHDQTISLNNLLNMDYWETKPQAGNVL